MSVIAEAWQLRWILSCMRLILQIPSDCIFPINRIIPPVTSGINESSCYGLGNVTRCDHQWGFFFFLTALELSLLSMIISRIFLHIPQLHVPAASKYSPCIMAVKRRVSLNRGAFILWNIAPVPVPEWITLAESPLSLIGLFLPPVLSLVVWNLEESQVCRQSLRPLTNFCLQARGNTRAHTLTCARNGRTRTHTHLGSARLSSSACQRAAPVNGNKTPWLAALS